MWAVEMVVWMDASMAVSSVVMKVASLVALMAGALVARTGNVMDAC